MKSVIHERTPGVSLHLCFCLLAGATALTAAELKLLPENIILQGVEARHRVLATRFDGKYAAPGEPVELKSSRPEIVTVGSDGHLLPVSNGEAVITGTAADGATAVCQVRVIQMERDHAWGFRDHVLPILTKSGCNSGACHGALAGKGGFGLSLLGYDAEGDWQSITRGARGRRVELANPAYSLLLTKPTAATSHKGGKLIAPDSRDYRILSEWVAAGTSAPKPTDVRVKHIEVLPELSLLKPGDEQPLLVRAHYGDGSVVDVTPWAKFTSSNEVVAMVDSKTGLVKVLGHGDGAITAWFDSQIVLARITSPFPHVVAAEVFDQTPRRNFIDDLVLSQLERLNLKPSPRSSDSEFIRRVYLDTIGLLPTPEETRAFLISSTPDKRDQIIDHLLSRPEYADYWTYRWSDLLMVNGRLLRPEAVKAYHTWLHERVATNTPWDELARQLVTAVGDSFDNGATNFFAVNQDPETMAENVSQTFLALSINCAKCHNHPLEKWTNDQYYAFANLFARVRAKGWGGDPRGGDGLRTLYIDPRGELIQPRTGRPQIPAPLDGEPLDPGETSDRRKHLADWLTSPDNPYFARTIANRVWAAYFGIGIVDPVDDLRASNPASNEPLLAGLASFLNEQKFDLKALMKQILQSETYQRSSVSLPENADEMRYFSRHYPRRLMAEILHDAIATVTEVPGEFTAILAQDGSRQETKFYPKGTRALQLYDSAVASYFLKTFGRNEREIACECERSNQPSIVQTMHLSNGDTLNARLSDSKSRVTHLLERNLTDSDLLDEVFMLCLSRQAQDEERQSLVPTLAAAAENEKRAVLEDLFWALMTSREFLFQH